MNRFIFKTRRRREKRTPRAGGARSVLIYRALQVLVNGTKRNNSRDGSENEEEYANAARNRDFYGFVASSKSFSGARVSKLMRTSRRREARSFIGNLRFSNCLSEQLDAKQFIFDNDSIIGDVTVV